MKTELFSLANANDVYRAEALVRTIRYDSGAAAGGVEARIRVRSILGGAYDVEMIPGRLIKLPEVTRGIVITNLAAGGAAINGKITFGAGDINDNSLVGSVDLTAATINNLIAAPYAMRPEAATAFWSDVTTMAAGVGGLLTVFNPAINTAGVIVDSAQLADYVATHGTQAFIAKNGAPGSISDGEIVLQSSVFAATSGQWLGGTLPKAIRLPANVGLYFMSTLAGTAGYMRSCRFRVLP